MAQRKAIDETHARDAPAEPAAPTAPNPDKSRLWWKATLRRWTRIALVFTGACMAAGFASDAHRYCDLLSAFQLQYFWMATALALSLAALRSWRWAVAGLLLALVAGAQVVPWYLPRADGTPSIEPRQLRLMLANVFQENQRRDELCRDAQALDPDVIVLEEVDESWRAALQPLGDGRPYAEFVPGTYLRGIAVFSRFELTDRNIQAFGNPLAPSLVYRLHVGGEWVTLLVTHPWPAIDDAGLASRNEQLALVGAFAAERAGPRIVVGDLNTTMWSATYRRLIRQTGLRNAREGFGVLPSFPMDKLPLLRIPLDHCLISSDLAVMDCRVGSIAGSDHACVIVDLRVRSAGE